MQLLVSLTLVAALATALQFIQTTGIPPNALSAQASAPIDQPSTQAAGAIKNAKEAVSDQVANKQCPKPQVKNGVQEIYNSKKPLEQPYTENGKKYYNLFGRNCKGPFIDSFCSKENFCDAKTFANSECFFDGKWQACKTPDGVQVASANNGTVCDACPNNLGIKEDVPPPVQSKGPVTGNQQIKDAYTPPPATASAPPASGGTAKPTAAQQVSAIAERPSPDQSTGIDTRPPRVAVYNPPPQNTAVTMSPTSPTATGPMHPSGPTGPTGIVQSSPPPTAQNTFPRPTFTPPGQSTGRNTGSRFSNFFSNFSIQSLFSGVTNLMTNVVTQSQARPATVVQDTTVVRTQQPVVVPTTQVSQQNMQTPAIIPGQQRTSVQYPGNLGVPSTIPVEVSAGTSVSARDIGKAVRITIPEQDDPTSENLLKEAVAESPREIVRASSSAPRITPQVPSPALFTNTASSGPEHIRQAFIEKAVSLSTVLESDFRPASTTRRSSALVEVFHAISISDLLDAITQGSMDLIRRVLARGEPEHPVILTQYEEPEVSPVILGSAPTLPSGANTQSGTGAGRAESGTSAPSRAVEERERFEERISKNASVVFQDASPVHRTDDYVQLERPSNIYPDVVPVPVRREAVSTAPSLLELVVKNGALEIKKLFTTVWRIILPPRE